VKEIQSGLLPPNGVSPYDGNLVLASTCSGSTGRFFVDGSQVGTDVTVSGTIFNGTGTLSMCLDTSGDHPPSGVLSEIRKSKGVAR
jgi:hypothetical protein